MGELEIDTVFRVINKCKSDLEFDTFRETIYSENIPNPDAYLSTDKSGIFNRIQLLSFISKSSSQSSKKLDFFQILLENFRTEF